MGYNYCAKWTTAKEIVAEKVQEWKGCGSYVAHKKTGNCLWMVVVNSNNDSFIALYLLKKEGNTWGYKDMCEAMHPYYYSCPLEFLDMTEEKSTDWRVFVRQWHERQELLQAMRKTVKVGDFANMIGTKIPYCKITSLTPFQGLYMGKLYRLKWDFIDGISEVPSILV
jgi:hypothetical protein